MLGGRHWALRNTAAPFYSSEASAKEERESGGIRAIGHDSGIHLMKTLPPAFQWFLFEAIRLRE